MAKQLDVLKIIDALPNLPEESIVRLLNALNNEKSKREEELKLKLEKLSGK